MPALGKYASFQVPKRGCCVQKGLFSLFLTVAPTSCSVWYKAQTCAELLVIEAQAVQLAPAAAGAQRCADSSHALHPVAYADMVLAKQQAANCTLELSIALHMRISTALWRRICCKMHVQCWMQMQDALHVEHAPPWTDFFHTSVYSSALLQSSRVLRCSRSNQARRVTSSSCCVCC